MTAPIWADRQLETLDELRVEVRKENRRQVIKWGIQRHTPAEWALIIGEEFGELCQALCSVQFVGENGVATPSEIALDEVWGEAIQVATLALKIAEMAAASKGAP